MKKKLILMVTILGIYFLVGCKKTDTASVAPITPVVDPCIGVTIVPVAT
jgi:hypothetical protein